MILAAVFLLSLASLTFEVLLARIFSITQWNHLSFMVISIALFGFAVSGTFLNILDARRKGWEQRLASGASIITILILYSSSTLMAFIILNHMPFDYFRLPVEPVQIFYLLAAYVLLALPFFFTGCLLSLAYVVIPEKTGLIYFASMAGSACGALLPVPLLPWLGPEKIIVFTTLLPLILTPFGSLNPTATQAVSPPFHRRSRLMGLTAGLGIVLGALLAVSIGDGLLIRLKPSPYKALRQMLQYPDTRITATTNSIWGRIDSLESPYVRYAPGLSLKYTDALPDQRITFKDADDPLVLFNLQSSTDLRFTDFLLLKSGYLLAPDPRSILVILFGSGGLSIPCALAAGAKEMTVVHHNPQIARIVEQHYHIPVTVQNPRAYLKRSHKRFQIIHIENWGASLPGSGALSQEYLLTVDAFKEYLDHLVAGGILIISRHLLLPPADSIRLWATAYEGLKSVGIRTPERHIALLRNFNTFTLIVSTQPMTDTGALIAFADEQNFDLVYLHNAGQNMANRFNIFDAPFHFLEIRRLAEAYRSGTQPAYFKAYPLDVTPQTDRRPFPGRLLKWPRLKALYQITGSRLYSLILSGEVVVGIVFLEALTVAVLLLVFPLFMLPQGYPRPSRPHILYFLAVGAGFMFVELFFIKQYTFVFGDPLVSLTVVLSGMLVFSGLGGYGSQRIGPRGLVFAFIALIVLLVFLFFGLERLTAGMLGLTPGLRCFTALLVLAPVGFLTGLPFPFAMRCFLQSPGQRAYAWTANGCASVLTSIMSAQIALGVGLFAIIAAAAATYLVAFVSLTRIHMDKIVKIC